MSEFSSSHVKRVQSSHTQLLTQASCHHTWHSALVADHHEQQPHPGTQPCKQTSHQLELRPQQAASGRWSPGTPLHFFEVLVSPGAPGERLENFYSTPGTASACPARALMLAVVSASTCGLFCWFTWLFVGWRAMLPACALALSASFRGGRLRALLLSRQSGAGLTCLRRVARELQSSMCQWQTMQYASMVPNSSGVPW